MAKTQRKTPVIRYDSRRARLRTGETQRSNGEYMYRWTDEIGRHCIYAPTLSELREKEEKIVKDLQEGLHPDKKAMTINELFDLWRNLKRGIKDTTFQNYCYMYRTFVAPTFGKKQISAVKKSDVRKFYNQLIEIDHLQVNTVDNIHTVLHQVFQLAVDDNFIRVNPTDNMLREVKIAFGHLQNKRRALTIPEQNLFLNFLRTSEDHKRWFPIFFVFLNTGMRVGELTGLRWKDVDLEKKTISVNHTLVYYDHHSDRRCTYGINTPKTTAGERLIPMTEAVCKCFLLEREFQDYLGIQSIARIDGYDDFIFVNRFGNLHNQASLNRALHRIILDCNQAQLKKSAPGKEPLLLPGFTCHVLRHTFATRLCESGINLKVIQNILGHADVSTTMNIYISVTEDLKKHELIGFEDYMDKARKTCE